MMGDKDLCLLGHVDFHGSDGKGCAVEEWANKKYFGEHIYDCNSKEFGLYIYHFLVMKVEKKKFCY